MEQKLKNKLKNETIQILSKMFQNVKRKKKLISFFSFQFHVSINISLHLKVATTLNPLDDQFGFQVRDVGAIGDFIAAFH